ncbi:MAG: bifunctional 4-hydroxy-2-oxoglutarate aldolase/2-dehydro-3-deoxy-phosphogluconate aldolase [Gaiellaceae bacterium]
MTPDGVLKAIAASRIVAVIRTASGEQAVGAAGALAAGGISAVEVALTTPDAATAIRKIRTAHPELLVGAGTVLSSIDVTVSVEAGAAFVVSPGLAPEVLDAARRAPVLAIPGVLTPTEVQRALGFAPLLKLFPAGLGGPKLLQALRGPFPEVQFMPTGGVAAENLAEWFAAGAFAVGAGTDLCPPDALERTDYDAITRRAQEYLSALERA